MQQIVDGLVDMYIPAGMTRDCHTMGVLHILREASASLLVQLYRAIPEPPYVERATVQTSRFLYIY